MREDYLKNYKNLLCRLDSIDPACIMIAFTKRLLMHIEFCNHLIYHRK